MLAHLSPGECLTNLSLLPTCGAQFFKYQVSWERLYSEDFTGAEKLEIIHSLQRATVVTGREVEKKVWGDVVDDRGSQITYSALGQQAPLEES